MKIILLGFSYVGKTTLGRAIAQELNVPFLDIDLMVEELHDMSVEDIFDKLGESQFRIWEREVLFDFLNRKDDVIISLGGGTPCYSDNMEMCLANGLTVFLDLPKEIILERCRNAEVVRPIFRDIEYALLPAVMENYMTKRYPTYHKAHIIYTNPSPCPKEFLHHIGIAGY
ncbi:MAG: shikimate kinase [Bacteroidales bacterium]|jgi:shikimate kinase|nr:shikimate kinase [Bacteroidales bacterium]